MTTSETKTQGNQSKFVSRRTLVARRFGRNRLAVVSLAVLVGFGRTSAEARANPSLRYEILVKSGSVMKALVPGSVLEPDSGITDELVWRDAGTVSGFEVSVRAG